MKLLVYLGLAAFGAVAVVAQTSDQVITALMSLTRDSNTAYDSTEAITQDNVGTQSITAFFDLANVAGSTIGYVNEFAKYNATPFSDDVAQSVVSAYGDYTGAYAEFLNALVEKHDILVSKDSPFQPDASSIGDALPKVEFVIAVFSQYIINLVPTRKEEANALASELNDVYEDTIKVYPAPTDDAL